MAHLLGRAGAADDPAGAQRLGDLADGAADGAGRAGDEDDVALAQAGDPGQARVCREAGHPEHAQVGGGRGGVDVDDPGVLRLDHRDLPPAEGVQHVVTHFEAVGA